MAFSIGQLSANVTANTSGFSASMNKVRAQGASVASSVQKNFRSIGRSMQRVGSTMTKAITLPILGIGAASAKVSSGMQDDLAQAAAQADLTGEQVSFIGDAAEETAIRTGESTSDIIEAYKFTISAGKSLAESQKIVAAAAEASAAGFGEQRDLVRTATTAMNAYGEEVDSGRDFMDTLVGAAQNMELEVSKLSRAFQKNVGIAKQLGIGMDELMAGIGSVSEIMGDANRGGRLFSTMMAKLLKPTGEGAEAIEDVFGSVSNLRESIADRGLLATMVELRKELEATSEEGLGLVFSQRSLEAALNLTNQEGERTKQIMGDMGDTTGATNSAFQKSATFSRKLSQSFEALKSAMRPIGNTIINSLKPAIESSIDLFKDMGDSLKAMSDEVKQRGLVIAGVLGASGPILTAVGALTAAIGAISWPVILGVGAFAGATTAIASNWDSIVAYFTSGDGAALWESIKTAATEVWGSLKELFSATGSLISDFSSAWGSDVTAIVTKSVSIIAEAVTKIIDSISLVIHLIRGDWKAAWRTFKDVATSNMENLDKQMFLSMSSMMKSATAMTNLLTGDFKTAFEQFKFGYGFDNVYTQFRKEHQKNASAVGNSVQKMLSDIQSLNEFLGKDFISNASQTAESVSRSFKSFDIGTAALDDTNMKMNAIKESSKQVSNSLTGIPENLEYIYRGGNLTAIAMENASKSATQVSRAAQTAGQALGQMFSQAILHGKDFMGVLKNIIKQLASQVFVQGVMALITGGGSLVKGSIGESIFGGLFHEGGIVQGSGNQPIMAKGGEGVFTRDQMQAMGGMMRNGGGGHDIDYSKIEQAFGRAFDKRIQRLGDSEIFAMAQRGKRGY